MSLTITHDRNAVKQQSPGSRSAPWVKNSHSDRLTTATRSNNKAQGRAEYPGSGIPIATASRPQRGQTTKPRVAQRTLGEECQWRPPHDRNAVKQQSPGSRSAPWVKNSNSGRLTTATRSNNKAQGRAAHPGSRIPIATASRPQRGQTSKPRVAQRTLGLQSRRGPSGIWMAPYAFHTPFAQERRWAGLAANELGNRIQSLSRQ
jgi:hypothetical protein